jgi:hypothetical protein
MTETDSSLRNVMYFNYHQTMDNVHEVCHLNKPSSQTFRIHIGVLVHVCPADLIRWQNKKPRFVFQVLDRLFSPAQCDSEPLRICPWSCVVRVQVRALFPLHLCGNKERGGNEVGTTASEHPVTMTAQSHAKEVAGLRYLCTGSDVLDRFFPYLLG